jgi:hypothetical protein
MYLLLQLLQVTLCIPGFESFDMQTLNWIFSTICQHVVSISPAGAKKSTQTVRSKQASSDVVQSQPKAKNLISDDSFVVAEKHPKKGVKSVQSTKSTSKSTLTESTATKSDPKPKLTSHDDEESKYYDDLILDAMIKSSKL